MFVYFYTLPCRLRERERDVEDQRKQLESVLGEMGEAASRIKVRSFFSVSSHAENAELRGSAVKKNSSRSARSC